MARKKGGSKLEKKVRAIEKRLPSMMPEVKHYDNYGSILPDYTGTVCVSPFRGVVQGDTDGTRTGDKLLVRTATLRSTWAINTNNDGDRRVRLIAFIYKKNPDAITTSYSTIINLYLQSILSSDQAPIARQDWDNHGSFKTIYDKSRVIKCSSNNLNLESKIIWDVSLRIPKKYRQIAYSVGSGNITENELIWCFIQDGSGGSDTVVEVDYNMRHTYTDP